MSFADPGEERRLVPSIVARWLVLIAISFVIGDAALALWPSASSEILTFGVWTNIVMAVSLGILLGWRMQLDRLPVAIAAGALVTVAGADSLDGRLLVLDLIAIVVAFIGMSILLVAGATAGTAVRALTSGCRCLRTQGRRGMAPTPRSA